MLGAILPALLYNAVLKPAKGLTTGFVDQDSRIDGSSCHSSLVKQRKQVSQKEPYRFGSLHIGEIRLLEEERKIK